MNSLQRRDVLLSRFQRDWYAGYLTSLRVRHTNGYPSINATPKLLKAGSVVLVRHPVKSRPYWSMARITEIVPGSDGEIRVVKIRTSQGKQSCISVSNLYPLELESSDQEFVDCDVQCPEDDGQNINKGYDIENVNNNDPSSELDELSSKSDHDKCPLDSPEGESTMHILAGQTSTDSISMNCNFPFLPGDFVESYPKIYR